MTKSEWKWTTILSAIVLVAFVGMAIGIWSSRRQFERIAKPGVSASDLVRVYGPPYAVYHPGDTIGSWGLGPSRTATKEVWLFSLFPAMSNRDLVTLDGDAISTIEFYYD